MNSRGLCTQALGVSRVQQGSVGGLLSHPDSPLGSPGPADIVSLSVAVDDDGVQCRTEVDGQHSDISVTCVQMCDSQVVVLASSLEQLGRYADSTGFSVAGSCDLMCVVLHD